jgi:hypothetical protein
MTENITISAKGIHISKTNFKNINDKFILNTTKSTGLLSKYSITVPVNSHLLNQAKKNGKTIKPDIVKVYIETPREYILPRQADVLNLSDNVTIVNYNDCSLPNHECAIELTENQQLIVDYIFSQSNKIQFNLATFLLQLETGYGKTYIGANMISKFNKKTLWILPGVCFFEQKNILYLLLTNTGLYFQFREDY